MDSIQVFNYEGNQVRTVEYDGETWFVANDVAQVLGYKNPQKAIRDHVYNEDKRTERIVHPFGGTQDTTIINEAGVYALIFTSKVEGAEKFKYWLAHEVLPQIRKNGTYGTTAELMRAKVQERANEIEAAKLLQDMVKTPAYGLSESDKRKITRELVLRLAGINVLVDEAPAKPRKRRRRYVETDPELIDFRTPSEIADAPYDVINVFHG